MADEVKEVRLAEEPKKAESAFLGISIRAWLALIIISTTCLLAGIGRSIEEPLYSMSIAALSFYFGQKVTAGPSK